MTYNLPTGVIMDPVLEMDEVDMRNTTDERGNYVRTEEESWEDREDEDGDDSHVEYLGHGND